MESCVNQLMADPKMKSKYSNPKERKSHSIAICHTSIGGGKKLDILLNDLLKENDKQKGGEENMAKIQKDKKVKGEDLEVKKQDPAEEVKPEEVVAEEVKEEVAVDESPKKEVVEEKPVEEVVEEKPAEESVEEPIEEKPAEEVPVEEQPEVKVDNTSADAITKILEKVSKLEEYLAKQDEPVEEVKEEAPVEEAKEEVAEEVEVKPEVVVEEPKEEAVAEEKVAVDSGVGESLQKIETQVSDLIKRFEEVEGRIKSIEDQPAPSKIFSPAVVKKGDITVENNGRLGEVNKELKSLEDLKNTDIKKYQDQRKWEEAFKLLAEREQLLLRA